MMGAVRLLTEAGITYRQLDHWVRVGYLTPYDYGDHFTGSGHPREFTQDQVRLAVLMGRLTRAGLLPATAHAASRQILIDGSAQLGDFILTEAAAA